MTSGGSSIVCSVSWCNLVMAGHLRRPTGREQVSGDSKAQMVVHGGSSIVCSVRRANDGLLGDGTWELVSKILGEKKPGFRRVSWVVG